MCIDLQRISVVNSTKDKWCCSGGYLIIDYRNRTVMENIIYPTVKCSLTKKCITPIGSHRRNHIQDQSVISIFVQSLGIHQACDPQHPSSVSFHQDAEKCNNQIDTYRRLLQTLKSKYNITVTSNTLNSVLENHMLFYNWCSSICFNNETHNNCNNNESILFLWWAVKEEYYLYSLLSVLLSTGIIMCILIVESNRFN